MLTPGVTGPKSVTAQRFAAHQLMQDNKELWKSLSDEHGFRLLPNAKKHRRSSRFVLTAVRGKGKCAVKFESSKFKLTYKSKSEAREINNLLDFGHKMLSHLQNERKRYRGTDECKRADNWNDNTPAKKKRYEHKDLADRICVRASSNGVEREAFAATQVHACFKCVGDMSKKGVISNFIRSLK